MWKVLAVSLAVCVLVLAAPARAQEYGESGDYEPFSPDQLDNLLAPIALYPDPLLAQVLVAATFPDQIDEAARFVRWDSDADHVDDQPWDVSVKAVAHYPEVLDMMADKLDWTTAVGQAYVYQSTDVMTSVQRLRMLARSAGSLYTTPEMEVVESGGWIELWPAQPQYIFVPRYDPAVVFFVRAPVYFFGRLFVGAWLNLDCDWRLHHLFYHGWEHGHGWVERSRPYIHVTNVYINTTYTTVVVNRNVIQRPVNYRALDRYDDVHRGANFDRFRGNSRVVYPPAQLPAREPVRNKVIVRNVNTHDPRLDDFRGHVPKVTTPIPHPIPPAFNPGHGDFEAKEMSRRGQFSRSQAKVLATPPPAQHVAGPKKVEKKIERKHP